MINIKNIDGSLLYAAPVTKDAVFHHELMSSEYIELVFNEVTVIDIPIGAYVEYNGSRYTVTNPVTPDIIDGGYKYSIQFKADWMRWEGITYFYINEFSQKNETSWSMTATPDLFLQMIVENISRATGKIYTFSYDSSLTATKDLQFNNTTVLEALSMVADAFETEWWIEGTVIHLSRCEHGDALALTYGQNIGVPSVQRSSEYATRIYAFGSTRNITQDYQNSGTTNALVEKRLTLPAGKYPNGYKDIKPNLSPEEIIEKTVIFDDIYPSSDFAISDVRVKVSVDSTTEVGKDENGNPIYASMPVYFFKIAGITFTDNLRIKGLELKVHFLTGHLQGREFELAYHKDTSEYEIIVNQDGAIKLPNETLLPQDNDVVVLFNIVMPDEYVTSAENRLEAALDDYIEKKLLSDNSTYSFKSNPVTFAENNTSVNVGRKITLNHGTGILQSRILSIEYPLEYPSKVDISVGESIPQGKISSVEIEVVNASSTIEIIQAYNNVAQTVQNLYARTQNQITEGLAKLANMWILDQSKDTTPNKTNPDVWFVRSPYDVVGLKGISAYGLGSTSGGSASGSLGELVNVGQWADAMPTADRVMVQLAGATHWSAKPLADLVGLDTAALAQYLTANSYLKASDISSYLTWANLSGKPTVYPTSWANIADKPTVYPTTWTSVTGRPTKLSQFTDDVVAGNYLPKPTWDAVFEVVTVDGTPALKVKYDILGLKGITAYADGSLSGGFSGALVDLVDVAVTNLASGDILKYNGTHFVNVPVSSIAGASSWDQITGKPEYYPTRWADVSGAPTSLPASDVYPWAKAASKPTYTAAEVGALPLSGGKMITGDFQFKDGVAVRDYDSKNIIGLLNIAGDGVCVGVGNGIRKTRIVTPDDTPVYRNDSKGTYRIYDSSNFNPDSKFNNLGQTSDSNNVVGNGYTLKELGATFSGPFLKWGLPGHMFEFFSANRINEIQIRHMSQGVWGDPVIMYHSGNFNPSSKLDKSVWDEAFELKTVNGVRVISAKLDFLSVAGISAYATGPSSGGGGGGLDYDLLKQALTGAITPDGYPFTISASFLGAIDKTYLTGKLANTYANKVHTHLWVDITDRPTALPANGGNADTVDNLHASSFAQIKSYNFPSGGINNITDLDFTGNIRAHFPGAEFSCIWQGKDFAGTILQLKLRDYAGKQSMMYRGSLTKTWRTVWDSGNFNPENYLPLSGGSITGGLGVSGYLTAGVLRVKATSYPQISFVNTTTNRDSLLFVNGSELYWRPTAGTATDYQVYHSGNFNPDSKFNNLGQANDSNNVVGNGYTLKELGATFSGPFLKWGLPGHMFEFFSANRINEIQIRHMSQGVWGDPVIIYHSGNLNPDNYLPLSGNKMITGDFKFKEGIAVRNAGGYNIVGLLNITGNGVCVAVGNGVQETRIVTPNDTPVYRNDGKGSYRIYDSSNFNPGNYLLLSGGTMTGDIAFGSNGRSLRGSDGGNIAGVLYDTPNARYVTAIGTGSRRLILISPASIYRGAGGVAENYMIYDSGNSNLSTVDWAAKNITASGTIVSMSTVESRGNNSTGILPQMLWHLPNVNYTRIRMNSNGTLHVIDGGTENYKSLYAQSFVAAGNVTAADTVTATKLVIGGITIDVYNGALRVNGNLVATGGVTAYQ